MHSLSPRLVVRREDSEMASSNELLVVETEDGVVGVEELRVEDDLVERRENESAIESRVLEHFSCSTGLDERREGGARRFRRVASLEKEESAHLHSIGLPVEELNPPDLVENGIGSVVDHVVSDNGRKGVSLESEHSSLEEDLVFRREKLAVGEDLGSVLSEDREARGKRGTSQ